MQAMYGISLLLTVWSNLRSESVSLGVVGMPWSRFTYSLKILDIYTGYSKTSI